MHCLALLPVPFLLALAFYPYPLTVVEKMSCERFWLLVSVLIGDHRLFFSGEWCLTHPSIALSCPMDSCYSLWRSQSVGPDEQGLILLTGRFLSISNHCRDKGRRWKGFVKWAHLIQQMCAHNSRTLLDVPAVPSPWSTILLLEQML